MNQEHNIKTGLPRVILHNTISLDGSLKGFEADLDMHYTIASSLKADAYLVGSQTVLDSSDEIPAEEETESGRPEYDPNDIRPFWVVVDSRSRLKGLLPYFRKMEHIKDIIVLISDVTPKDYQDYLKEKDYPYIRTGKKRVDLTDAFRQLRSEYRIETLLTDSGPGLTNVLLQQNLVDEISLVMAPFIVKQGQFKIFNELELKSEYIRLKVLDSQNLGNDHFWIRYQIRK